MPRRRGPRPKTGQRLKGTRYDARVPNKVYSQLIGKAWDFVDANGIRYYEASADDRFVRAQQLAGVITADGSDGVYWTLRPIERGAGRRRTPFPHASETIVLRDSSGSAYRAYVREDYRLPNHATGWVILQQIVKTSLS